MISNPNYSVLILAAGIGKRLSSVGKKTPKSLLKINGESILEKILKTLKKYRLNDITIATGYKKKKIKNLIKSKNYSVKFINIKDFDKNGSSFSWYSFKNNWEKNQKPLIILHADIYFDETLIKNILNSRLKNIIGSVCTKSKNSKKKWVVHIDKKNRIIKILQKKILKNKYVNEISCINKFSKKITKEIFEYMNIYFKKYGCKQTWEIVLNDFIKEKDLNIYSLNNQNFYWYNINTTNDYKEASFFIKN